MSGLPLSYSEEERRCLDGEARALLDANPRVIDLIARGASLNPEGAALVYLRTAADENPPALRYDEFMAYIAAAAHWLRAEGVGPEDAVAVLAPSCPAMVVAMWAATAVGVANPLNLLFSREAIAVQLRVARAKIMFTPPPGAAGGLYEKVAGLESEVPTLERIATLPLDGAIRFDGEALTPAPDWRAILGSSAEGEADRVAAMLPTGGTTGHPKIVRMTQSNMVASAIASMLAGGYRDSDRLMIGLPLFHVGGAFCAMLAAFGAGTALCLPTPLGMRNPEVVANFWRILERHGVTFTGMAPTSLGAIAAWPAGGADLSRLRMVITGASTCPPEIERRFLDAWGKGDAVRQVYGMTEFTGAIAQVPHDRAPDGAAVGLPVALAEVAVLADGKVWRGPSPKGELLARGPQIFAGYCDPRQTEGAFYEGWLRTGDLCQINESGQILIVGRIKDLIIRGGHNIDPVMIEDVALRFPGVALAAAVGLPDPHAGETPMLFVAPAAGASLDPAALSAFMAEHVAEPPARPRAIAIVEEIPLTAVGKVFKPRLREIAAEEAVRRMAAEFPDATLRDLRAATSSERGLVVRVGVEGDQAVVNALGEKLRLLPVTVEIRVETQDTTQ
jgi:fatty-acyl-CoA synthase